jgi:hypothetical protein
MTEYSGPLCPDCGGQYVSESGTVTTLVASSSPPGHNHDDNCLKRIYTCQNGHRKLLSIRRRCNRSDCDWVGKDDCFCTGPKINRWPVAQYPPPQQSSAVGGGGEGDNNATN